AIAIEGAKIDIDERPAVLVRGLRAESIYLVITARDGEDVRSIDKARENLALLQVGRDKDITLQAGCRGMGRDGVGEIPRGGACDDLKSELLGLRQRDRYHAVLEGESRMVDAVVLEVQIAE